MRSFGHGVEYSAKCKALQRLIPGVGVVVDVVSVASVSAVVV